MNMNPFEMLKNANALKGQLESVKEELETIEAQGSAGGGLIKLTLNGKFAMTSLNIDTIAVDPRDVDMLQDLIRAAHADAVQKIQEEIQGKLGPFMQGGFPL